MKKKHSKKSNGGFTLVEVIVVLVILAILATIMIPSLTGYIDKAGSGAAIAECRQCVLAAQTLASERYATRQTLTISDKAEIVALAESPAGSDLTELTVTNGSVERLVFRSSSGRTVTYADKTYTVDGTSVGGAGGGTTQPAAGFSDPATFASLKNVFSDPQYNVKPGDKINSGAAALDGSRSYQIKAALKDAGVDLDALDATSWQYAGDFFYWTPQDINGLSVGDTLPVMRYNYRSGSYTVWYAKIGTGSYGGTSFNAISNPEFKVYEPSTGKGVDLADQTYEKMLTDYANAVAGA